MAAACPDLASTQDLGYSFLVKAGVDGGNAQATDLNAAAQSHTSDAPLSLRHQQKKVVWSEQGEEVCAQATGCGGRLSLRVCGLQAAASKPTPGQRYQDHVALQSSLQSSPTNKLSLQCDNDWPAVCFDSNKQPFCANLAWDPQTCGCCSTNCANQQYKTCVNGQCAPCPTATPDICTWGATSYCVNLKTDVNVCGSCTSTCPKTGVAVCQNGVCNACPSTTAPNVCPKPDGTAVCVNFRTDNSNCGLCGRTCTSPATCRQGVCVSPSPPPRPPPPSPRPPPPSLRPPPPSLRPPPPGPSLPIIWSDEFNGNTLNASNWAYDVGAGVGFGNNENVYYTRGSNLAISNGNAVITAKYNPNGGTQMYTSTRMSTCGLRSFSPGIRIEARAQLPKGGQGIWPKIWVASPDNYYGGWPESGYMVVFEAQNTMANIYGSAFWGNPEGFSQTPISTSTYRPLTDFHTFAIDWLSDSLTFYLDGNAYLTIPCSRWFTSDSTNKPRGYCAPFDRPFCIGVNLAVGADLLGPGVDNSVLPQTLTLDYFRVYRLTPGPTPSPRPPPPVAKSPPPPSPSPPPPSGLQILWSDEFSGTSLNLANWGFQVGDACDLGYCGWGNNELEWYTAGSNVAVSNGNAVITVNYNPNGGKQMYTSTRMTTQGKRFYAPSNGVNGRGIRVEARIKLPTGGRGMWPAFWLMPNTDYYGPYPQSGELDIMEAINNLDTCYGTAHTGNPLLSQGGQTSMTSVVSQQSYHLFALDWTSTSLTWLLDGVPYYTLPCSKVFTSNSAGRPMGPCAPYDQPFYVIINVAVGGNWPGNNIDNSVFPQTMLIDYVRFYSL
eukprot:jgi/Botrbrau1/10314/Bobra.0120s0027.1